MFEIKSFFRGGGWFGLLFFVFQALFPFVIQSQVEVDFTNRINSQELASLGIISNDLEKKSKETAFSITGVNYTIYYRNNNSYQKDFQSASFRQFIYNSFIPLFFLLFYLAEFFYQKNNLLSSMIASYSGVFFTFLSLFFVVIDEIGLIRIFFRNTLEKIPSIQSYGNYSITLVVVSASILFSIGFVTYNDQRIKKMKNQ